MSQGEEGGEKTTSKPQSPKFPKFATMTNSSRLATRVWLLASGTHTSTCASQQKHTISLGKRASMEETEWRQSNREYEGYIVRQATPAGSPVCPWQEPPTTRSALNLVLSKNRHLFIQQPSQLRQNPCEHQLGPSVSLTLLNLFILYSYLLRPITPS